MEVRRRQAQSGFTLIESMVAMTILLIGLLALAMMQNVAFRANTLARNRTAAMILASQQIERLSRLGSANVSTGTGTSNVDGRNFTQSWACSVAPTATNNSKIVNMSVQWSDQWGSQTILFPTVVR
jgi:type II secretion system protein I